MARAHPQPATEAPPLRMSYDEWQAWYGKEERNRGEWVRGEVVPYMPPTVLHQEIVGFLYGLMYFYARHKNLGDVFVSETELWLPRSQAARQPDISFISNQHADRVTSHRLDGYADLVVEIISPDSVTRDRRQKFAEYQDAGIPEYWLIDPRPRRQSVSVFTLGADGRYQELAPPASGHVHSRVMSGFWIDPGWLWQDPLPDPYQILLDLIAEAER
jgi:Uma2 family endonuclease